MVDHRKQPRQGASFTAPRPQCDASRANSCAATAPGAGFDLSQIPVHRASERRSIPTAASTGLESNDAEATPAAPDETTPAPDASRESPAEPLSGELPGRPGACVFQAALPYSRSGITRSQTGTVGEHFEVRAEWRSDPAVTRSPTTSYCAAECGEYHQFIKGHMLSSPNKDGSNATDVSGTVFGGVPLEENRFHEDGLDKKPQARYGHRKERQTMDEAYQPDRATGPKYIGRDFPRVSIGTFADIDVTFLGRLVDTCNKTETMSDTWRVKYRGVIRP
jgi:hypothetical protein